MGLKGASFKRTENLKKIVFKKPVYRFTKPQQILKMFDSFKKKQYKF